MLLQKCLFTYKSASDTSKRSFAVYFLSKGKVIICIALSPQKKETMMLKPYARRNPIGLGLVQFYVHFNNLLEKTRVWGL